MIFADAFNYLLYKVVNEKGEIDVCKAMEAYTLRTEVAGAINILRDMDMSETEIAERVAKKFNVTIEYVKELMQPKSA